ncbi:esterase/lipase family protein [Aspergillus vadensis CBS 113365]|uniref:Alpha/beta-hydrolase n=1 Tax=Aspergillus vadensis (strain CBS 113365 / IMI 142717 / IBT 24658) TaxID=1448311 RepID=A0A319B0L6_ASPVC|nr:alpha/beta-hydrolase [Aspergillus vadensis CBS 113365]PYH63700.1 alpha/beta-hydrolase [Aspergillus vadensis CBS 113365]
MGSEQSSEGLDNLKILAKRLTNSHDSNTENAQKVPIVMVPGFSGWGTPLFGAVNYWGGIENIPQKLAEDGKTVIVTPIAPLSSNWERACELYAQLTSKRFLWYDLKKGTFNNHNNYQGIEVDYGDIFPRIYEYEQHTKNRKLPIIFTKDDKEEWADWVWSKDKPVHFICHSQGGNTVRYLLHLMERGSRNLTDATRPEFDSPAHATYFNESGRSNWTISVSTIGTPHRGSTIIDAIQDYFKAATPDEKTKLIGRLFAILSFNDPENRFYDLQLDHWGINRLTTAVGRESFPEMRARLESPANNAPVYRWLHQNHNGLYDNTIAGVRDLNNSTIPTLNNIYYFSLSFSCVKPFPKGWPKWTLNSLKYYPLRIREVTKPIPIVNGIARLTDNAVTLAAWSAESIATPFREVMCWATNYIINPFIEEAGYKVTVPGPPDYQPVPSVFPPMLPTAYAMGCYNLTECQVNILGDDTHDWKINDGVVNTASMKGPLNRDDDQRDNSDTELIADASQFPHRLEEIRAARGKYWHCGTTTGMDHADQIGIFIEESTVRLL